MTTPDYHHELARRFVLEVLRVSIQEPTEEAQARATQAYLNSLRPWVDLSDVPTLPRTGETLFEYVQFTEIEGGEDEDIEVCLSTAGQLFFCAWLRRRGLDPKKLFSYPSG